MYTDYFGFTEPPFSIAPDPRYLYMSEKHQEALAHLAYGASAGGCIILLTGEVGTGKTTICRCFLERLGPDTDVAVIINPRLTGNELLATICDELRITTARPMLSTKQHIDRLTAYLLETHAAGRQAVLVVDEAQNLALNVLEMLRLLTNLETNTRKLLKIFLLGQSELAAMLSRPEMTQVNQRITSRYHLTGLSRSEVRTYIEHRLTVAGGGRARLFSRAALHLISSLSRGIPRVINTLCDRALLGAYAEGKNRVDRRIVCKAAREIFGETIAPPKSAPRKWPGVMVGLVIFVLVLGIGSGTAPDRFEPGSTRALPAAAGPVPDLDPFAETTATEQMAALSGPSGEARSDTGVRELTRIVITPIEIYD